MSEFQELFMKDHESKLVNKLWLDYKYSSFPLPLSGGIGCLQA